jgi:hypothetical protein
MSYLTNEPLARFLEDLGLAHRVHRRHLGEGSVSTHGVRRGRD